MRGNDLPMTENPFFFMPFSPMSCFIHVQPGRLAEQGRV